MAMWEFFLEQIKKENSQYITWTLVFIGWFIAALIAWRVAVWQEKKNKYREGQALSREIISRLSDLEDRSISFWLCPSNLAPELELHKLARDLKSITAMSMALKEHGMIYPSNHFISLRKSISLYDGPLTAELPNSFRIKTIMDCCSKIRKRYQ